MPFSKHGVIHNVNNMTISKYVHSRHGTKLEELSWEELYDEEFPLLMTIIDLLQTLPPTSVQCETTFSQMKLIKTSRRTRMRESTLNDLLTIKLSSTSVDTFDPEESINTWLVRKILIILLYACIYSTLYKD